ncbi:MAG TPA: hypothetical protein VF699_11230 [Caulobacteraceae bacterium]|jgi:hypothetical protein
MQRTLPRNVVLTGCLVAVLGLWFGLRTSPTLAAYGDCLAAHGYGSQAVSVCDLEVR